MLKKLIVLTLVCFFVACAISAEPNTLTQQEKKEGWQLLFDGTSTDQWKGSKSDTFPEKGWTVEDGILTIQADQKVSGIVTKKMYKNFKFSFDFKMTKGANSGVKYFVQPNTELGCEFQILDDENHPDAKKGIATNRTVSSLYDLISAENKTVNPVGEWNHGVIVVKDGKVEHWLNGSKTVEYDRFTQMFRALIQTSKYAKLENFGLWETGHIHLQNHNDKVSFRNLKILELE